VGRAAALRPAAYNCGLCVPSTSTSSAMPIYAYKCGSCGHAKDVLQKVSDAPLSTCPSCGQESFSKQVTAAGFQLKGSGWYATDFRNNGSAKPADKKADTADSTASDTAKPADASTSSGQGQPADAKPAEKSVAAKPDTPAASGGGRSCASA
jgi:putative FmdB family regulatory protein